MKHYLTPTEYIKLIRNLADLASATELDVLRTLLIELAQVPDEDGIYELDEHLTARLAIVNMCDATLHQYHTSNGEVDYALLGRNSQDVVEGIMRSIYYFVP